VDNSWYYDDVVEVGGAFGLKRLIKVKAEILKAEMLKFKRKM